MVFYYVRALSLRIVFVAYFFLVELLHVSCYMSDEETQGKEQQDEEAEAQSRSGRAAGNSSDSCGGGNHLHDRPTGRENARVQQMHMHRPALR